MKIPQAVFAGVLILALGATWTDALPVSATAAPIAAHAAPAQARPSDLFGVSLLSAAAECGAAATPTEGGDPLPFVCGQCSPVPCRGVIINAPCGAGPGGKINRCEDYLHVLCPRGDGVRCRCS